MKSFFIKENDNLIKNYHTNKIVMIKADNGNSIIVSINKEGKREETKINKSLTFWESKGLNRFIRVSKYSIINMNYVISIDDFMISLIDKIDVVMAVNAKKYFLRNINLLK